MVHNKQSSMLFSNVSFVVCKADNVVEKLPSVRFNRWSNQSFSMTMIYYKG